MRNKEKQFKVVDLCNLCDVEEDKAYLVLNDKFSFRVLEFKKKKIRVTPKRYVEVEYDDDETVRAIIKNTNTGKYSVAVIPCLPNGVLDLYQLLQEKKINVEPLAYEMWHHMRHEFRCCSEDISIHDNAIIVTVDGRIKKLLPTSNGRFEDTEIYLKKVNGYDFRYESECAVLEKCLNGDTLVACDFTEILETSNVNVEFDFGKLNFKVKSGMVSVSKIIGGPEEKVTFQFEQTRIPDLAIFLDFVLRAESERQLVERMNKYFVF